MTDHETDPQRSPAPADAEPSHPTAELPRTGSGQSDSTTELPRTADGQPQTSASPAAAPVPADSPAAGTPAPTVSDAGHTAAPIAFDPGRAEMPIQPTSPYAPPAATPSAPPYQPQQSWYGGQQQGGWAQQGGYAPHGAGPVPPYQPHQPYPGGQPHQPGAPVPPWVPQHQPARPSRAGKFVGAGALALALMLGSGVAGGALALAVGGHTTVTRTYSAAPVINSADLPKIAAAVQDSIVTIMTDSGEGSGVILSADGYVLTNNHVVASASGDTVKVVFADGKTAQAKIVGTDPKTDLGVVKASGVSNLKAAKFGDSDAMQVGDQVLALGSPLGLQGSVTAGILSARDRTIQAGEGGQQQQEPQQAGSSISGLLQTDAPINPGNSGGALVNTRGEVIGINTAIATAGQGSNGNIGVGFAIPSNKAKDVAEKLQRGEKISHPSLGVSVTGAEDGGALVSDVVAGSAAEKAGLQRGDVVTKFGDKAINDSNDLVGAVQAGKVGDRVEVQFKRNGSTQTATVTLAETS
ncbi:trypsin-like peptidase domain-containing protein [Micromonospora soli]|uniref:trypsin-like peptidase domain-containing protein n=1 Tax=Micromonospora sp. NBRC 110009 TaxID=3061627 RepID=UPI00267195E3|nr:trypsin-like peptidase domain-containing protein [Micromonospora sp. NBRC 110009]WKU01927.1 trypsin-like peptidase domain-containing protein [Micromonospora sp. NBRC 110009]